MVQILFIQIITIIIHSAFAEVLVRVQNEPTGFCHFNVILPDNGKSLENVFEIEPDFSKKCNVVPTGFQPFDFYLTGCLENEKIIKENINNNLHRFILFETGVSPPLS